MSNVTSILCPKCGSDRTQWSGHGGQKFCLKCSHVYMVDLFIPENIECGNCKKLTNPGKLTLINMDDDKMLLCEVCYRNKNEIVERYLQ